MKLPRDVDGPTLVKALRVLGYEMTRQKGFYIRITTQRDGENHEVFRATAQSNAGTLSSILKRIAAHHRLTVEELFTMLDV